MRQVWTWGAVMVLTVAVGVSCETPERKQAKADVADIEAMIESAQAKCDAEAEKGRNPLETDGATIFYLLARERGLVDSGVGGLRPVQRMRDFANVMSLERYNALLKKVLTPDQFSRLHELREKYKYVQWVEPAK